MHGGSASRVQHAVAATFAAGNARVATYTSFDSPVPAESDARGSGVIDFANGRSQVTDRLVTTQMLEESERRDSRGARRIKRALSGSTELLFDRGQRYVRADESGWTPGPEGERRELRPQDPRWFLDLLAGASDDIVIVGACDVRGTPTKRQRITVDFCRAARETPGGLGMPDVAPRRWFRRPSPTAPAAMPVEVWLDNEQRVRRASVAPLSPRPGDERVLWAVLELCDFGRAPCLTVPE